MVWLMGATEMADTESGDRAALLLISTFFQPAPDAESGDKIREHSSLAPDPDIFYRITATKSEQLCFFPGTKSSSDHDFHISLCHIWASDHLEIFPWTKFSWYDGQIFVLLCKLIFNGNQKMIVLFFFNYVVNGKYSALLFAQSLLIISTHSRTYIYMWHVLLCLSNLQTND